MNQWLAFGTVWSLFVATVSVAFAVLSHRRQVNASVYLDVSKQLHELYKRMPKRPASNTQAVEVTEATRSLVFDSLQLIRSAFTLAKAGYFTGPLWKNLRDDAEKALRKPAFRELWPEMRAEFLSDPAYVAYVDRVQAS
jgi:hypothetical protein